MSSSIVQSETVSGSSSMRPQLGSQRAVGAEHPIHASLVRPLLYLGVERTVIALEATLALALVLGVGPGLPTFGLVALIILVVHPTLAWLTARDPMATEIYVRSRAYDDYYAPHAVVERGAPRPLRSIPKV